MTDHKKTKAELEKLIEDKIDEMSRESFPASDAPSFSALVDIEHKIEDLKNEAKNEPSV